MDLNHQMELISIALTTAICAACGCTWSHRVQDHGIDLSIHGEDWPSGPQLDIQIKSTRVSATPSEHTGYFRYPLRSKNYNDLVRRSFLPQVLILVLLPEDLNTCVTDKNDQVLFKYGVYWVNLRGMPLTINRHTISIDIPLANRFNPVSLKQIMTMLDQRGGIEQ